MLQQGQANEMEKADESDNTAATVGSIFRDHLDWIRNNGSFTDEQRKAANAIALCKTPALGTYVDYCPECKKVVGVRHFACNNRNCPNCQYPLQEKWIQMRKNEVIPGTPYFHVILTLPHELNSLVSQNAEPLLSLLFRSSAQAVIEMCEDPHRLGAKPGIVSVLHTWTQDLRLHYHIHMICSAGGINSFGNYVNLQNLYRESEPCGSQEKETDPVALSVLRELQEEDADSVSQDVNHASSSITAEPEKTQSGGFFLPENALASLFRGKFMAGLREMYENRKLALTGELDYLNDPRDWSNFCHALASTPWIGHIARTFEEKKGNAIDYLARYVFRTAISNSRIVGYDGQMVSFLVRNNETPGQKDLKKLNVYEFISRFLSHILPKGFTRVRFYGFLANGRKTQNLQKIFQQIHAGPYTKSPLSNLRSEELFQALFPDTDFMKCPFCGGKILRYQTDDLRPYLPALCRTRAAPAA